MPQPPVPPLSWLYVPGDRPERFEKALGSGASVVIVDLEDAVAPDRKADARRHVAALLRAGRSPASPPVHVRVNALGSPWGREDLAALAPLGEHGGAGVRLPKVESTDELDAVAGILGGTPLFALAESARGLEALREVARHPAVAGIALGEQDLRAELGLSAPEALDRLRVDAVVTAAAAGLGPVPAPVYADVRDETGFVADTRRLRGFGLYGRTCLHPRQVALTREAHRPDDAELAWAREVVAAAGSAEHGAALTADGQFVDAPVLGRARAVLDLAERLAEPDPVTAEAARP